MFAAKGALEIKAGFDQRFYVSKDGSGPITFAPASEDEE
jgi:hypothetical protein